MRDVTLGEGPATKASQHAGSFAPVWKYWNPAQRMVVASEPAICACSCRGWWELPRWLPIAICSCSPVDSGEVSMAAVEERGSALQVASAELQGAEPERGSYPGGRKRHWSSCSCSHSRSRGARWKPRLQAEPLCASACLGGAAREELPRRSDGLPLERLRETPSATPPAMPCVAKMFARLPTNQDPGSVPASPNPKHDIQPWQHRHQHTEA